MPNLNRKPATKPEILRLPRHDAKLVREAMAHVVVAIAAGARPDPDYWHDLTRGECEARNVMLDAPLLRCQQALEAAKAQGPAIQAATIRNVEIYFATLCAIALRDYQVDEPASPLAESLVTLAEEHADVVMAAHRAQYSPSPRNLAALRNEILEARDVGEPLVDEAAAQLVRI